jgi:tungstate transport system ATP-binding protein
MNNNSALGLNEVSYSHEKGKALFETTLNIQKDKITIILGPNGAGKSILLKLCHGLLEPETGKINFGESFNKSAMVFPKPVFFRRTVLENLKYILRTMNADTDQLDELAKEALVSFSMEKFSNHSARSLSSGEKQRLSLIRALLLNPDILYLDEPTANLDPKTTALLEDMIGGSRKKNITVVMATHDLMQAKRIADEVIFINEGKIVEKSDAATFFKSAKTVEARNFLSGKL